MFCNEKQITSMLLTLFLYSFTVYIVKAGNKLTGPIPTEIGLLTDLTWLQLGKRLLSVLLSCFETKQIGFIPLTSFL